MNAFLLLLSGICYACIDNLRSICAHCVLQFLFSPTEVAVKERQLLWSLSWWVGVATLCAASWHLIEGGLHWDLTLRKRRKNTSCQFYGRIQQNEVLLHSYIIHYCTPNWDCDFGTCQFWAPYSPSNKCPEIFCLQKPLIQHFNHPSFLDDPEILTSFDSRTTFRLFYH